MSSRVNSQALEWIAATSFFNAPVVMVVAVSVSNTSSSMVWVGFNEAFFLF
jgi:hypothetical protein